MFSEQTKTVLLSRTRRIVSQYALYAEQELILRRWTPTRSRDRVVGQLERRWAIHLRRGLLNPEWTSGASIPRYDDSAKVAAGVAAVRQLQNARDGGAERLESDVTL